MPQDVKLNLRGLVRAPAGEELNLQGLTKDSGQAAVSQMIAPSAPAIRNIDQVPEFLRGPSPRSGFGAAGTSFTIPQRDEPLPESVEPRGIVESFQEEITPTETLKKVPIIGGIAGAAENLNIVNALDRIQKNAYGQRKRRFGFGPAGITGTLQEEQTKAKDEKLIEGFLEDVRRDQERPLTFGGKVVKGVTALPTWMAEFALTGGLANIGSQAAQKAVVKILQNQAKTQAGKLALRAAGWTGGAITRATLGLGARTAEEATGRQAQVKLGLRDKENWATSLAKAWGNQVIESASETAGGPISKVISAPFKAILNKTKFGKAFINKLKTSWMGKTGGTEKNFFDKIITKGGYSNIIGEVGEERLGTALRAIAGTEDFGTEKGSDAIDRLYAGMRQDFENIGVEAAVLAVPGAGRAAINRLVGRSEVPPEEAPFEPTPEPAPIPSGIVEPIPAGAAAVEKITGEVKPLPTERAGVEAVGKLTGEKVKPLPETKPELPGELKTIADKYKFKFDGIQEGFEDIRGSYQFTGLEESGARGATVNITTETTPEKLEAFFKDRVGRFKPESTITKVPKKGAAYLSRDEMESIYPILGYSVKENMEVINVETGKVKLLTKEEAKLLKEEEERENENWYYGLTSSQLEWISEFKRDHRLNPGKEQVFYRKGNIPPAGKSYNYAAEKWEDGVSVYFTPTETSFAGMDERDWYYGKGRQVSWGSDNEPVIVATEKWKKYVGPKKAKPFVDAAKKEEAKDAEKIREDEGQISEAGIVERGRAEEGRKDIQFPTKGRPKAGIEEEALKEEVPVSIGKAETTKETDQAVKDIAKPEITPEEPKIETPSLSARQADIKENRKSLGLDGTPSKEKKTWKASLQNAKDKKIPARAHRIASDIVQNPRALSDEETAGLVMKGMQLKNEHSALMNDIAKEKDDATLKEKSAEAQRIESEFDLLSRAIRMSGTEKGRSLVAQKLTIDRDYNLLSVKTRAKAAKGEKLTSRENKQFETLVVELDSANKRIDSLQQKVDKISAQRVIKQGAIKRYKGMDKKQKDTELAGLVEQTKALLEAGC